MRLVASALRAFRRRRPLRGGSLLVTLVGDAVAPHGGDIALGSLITLAAPFGLADRLVRTSVSRLTHDGWFHTRRIGRLSYYRLTPDGTARFAEAAQRIYHPPPSLPRRAWTMVLMPGGLTARDAVARDLQWLGFGRMTPEVFVHPTCDPAHVAAHLQPHGAADEAIVMQASMQSRADEQRLVQASWNLADLSERYERMIGTFAPINLHLERGGDLSPADSFIVRTLLVHEYRRIVLRDPRLPTALLPDDWAGGRAYALCQSLYARVFGASESHLQQIVAGTAERWRALDTSVTARFGGVLAPPLLERGLFARGRTRASTEEAERIPPSDTTARPPRRRAGQGASHRRARPAAPAAPRTR